jgi:hypothetical protein
MLTTIKNFIIVGVLLFGVTLTILWWNGRKENQRLTTQVEQREKLFRDERNILVTNSYNVRVSNADLRQIRRRDSANLTGQERRIKTLLEEMEHLKIKPGNAGSGTTGDITSHIDTVIKYKIISNIPYIEPIRTAFWDIKFPVDTVRKVVGVEAKYSNTFFIILNRIKEKNSGETIKFPRLPWRWWRDWKYITTVSSRDTSASVTNLLTVQF